MSSRNNLNKPIIPSSQAKKPFIDTLDRPNENNKIYKKSLSFQDTENMTYLDASNIQDFLNNPNNPQQNNIKNSDRFNNNNNTNYDRDDSLNDVISFGKQTPFRFDNSNMNSYDGNLAASSEYANKSKDQQDNMSILNLRDTTIDEMFQQNENNQKFLKLDTTPGKKSLIKSDDFFNRINLNPEFELSFNIDNTMNESKFLQSTTRNTLPDHSFFTRAPDGSLTPKSTRKLYQGGGGGSPSRIPVRSKTNLNELNMNQEFNKDSLENDEFEINKTNNLNEKERNNEKNKINGAFKLFVSGTNLNKMTNSEVSFTRKEQELAELSEVNEKKPENKSPMTNKNKNTTNNNTLKKNLSNSTRTLDKSIKKSAKSNVTSVSTKPTKLPVKSPVLETVKAFQKNSILKKKVSTQQKNNQEEQQDRSRPPTTVNINYSLDSDESIAMDDLINNPAELKKILREGKMDKEQLNQLQENYLRLLEQYAEKENFIDTFRLGYNANMVGTAPVTPSSNMFQVSGLFNGFVN